MEIQICPHCHQRVMLSRDGICPGCRVRVVETGFGSVETLFSDNDPSWRDNPLLATDSMNPYQSPSYANDRHLAEAQSPGWRRILWLLFSFEGRIPRRVFWGATIITAIAYYAAVIPLAVIIGDDSLDFESGSLAGLPLYLLMLLMIWISLVISVKRWHDRDKSGWWVLIVMVPFIGPLWQFIETGCLRGTVGRNQYGPDPT